MTRRWNTSVIVVVTLGVVREPELGGNTVNDRSTAMVKHMLSTESWLTVSPSNCQFIRHVLARLGRDNVWLMNWQEGWVTQLPIPRLLLLHKDKCLGINWKLTHPSLSLSHPMCDTKSQQHSERRSEELGLISHTYWCERSQTGMTYGLTASDHILWI